MNHVEIASRALAFRFRLLHPDDPSPPPALIARLATAAVTAPDPTAAGAIRRLATAWVRHGLDPEALAHPWTSPAVDELFRSHPELIDALDDLIRAASANRAA